MVTAELQLNPALGADAGAILDELPDGFYAVDRQWRIVAMNQAAARCFRLDRKEAIGRSLWKAVPQLAGSELERRFRSAVASGVPDEFVTEAAVNAGRRIEVRAAPIATGLAVFFRDVTERATSEEAVRASEARLRLALEAGRMAVWEHDAATDSLRTSPELNLMLGYPPAATLDLAELRTRYYPGEQERLRATAMAALERGERFFDSEYRFYRADGELRWYQMRAEIRLSPDGAPPRTIGVLLDVTERKRTEEALRAREAELDDALAAGKLAIFDCDHTTGRFSPSPRFNALYDFPPDHVMTVEDCRTRYHPDDVPAIAAFHERYASDPSASDFKWLFRIIRRDGRVAWIEGRGEYIRDHDRRIVRSHGVVTDVTERKRWEEQQRLLVNELNHRVKNTLATVQSITRQTAKGTPSVEAFVDAFEARIRALSLTHNALTRGGWESASLREILDGELSPYAEHQVSLAGPDVPLPPRVALALGMVVHELATNAAKYGALSTAEGRVQVDYSTGVDPATLVLCWREFGGPPVTPPAREGFGSRLVRRSIAGELGGVVEFDYDPAGLRCRLMVPLTPAAEI